MNSQAINWAAEGALDPQTFDWASEHAPWALVIVVALSIIAWFLRILNDTSPTVKKILGPIGRYWSEKSARRFIRSGADYENMNEQILYLFGRVHLLEYESGLDHAFRVDDEAWHRRIDMKFAGEDIPHRRTYDEFRTEYSLKFPYRPPEVKSQDIG